MYIFKAKTVPFNASDQDSGSEQIVISFAKYKRGAFYNAPRFFIE